MSSIDKAMRVSRRWLDAINFSLSFKTPYRLGGEDPVTGMDCSGFAAYVLAHCGHNGDRLTADGYYNDVFSESAPAVSGGSAETLAAYFYRPSGTATHMGLFFGKQMVAHVSSTPRGRGPIDAISDPQPYLQSVGAEKVYAASELIDIARYVYDNRVALGLNVTHFVDGASHYWTSIPASSAAEEKLVAGAAAWLSNVMMYNDVAAWIVALAYGVSQSLVLDQMVQAEVDSATSFWSELTATMLQSYFYDPVGTMVYSLVAMWKRRGSVRYRLYDIYTAYAGMLGDPVGLSYLRPGLRMEMYSSLGTSGSWSKRYISGGVLNAMVDLDDSDGGGFIQSVPTRRVT